MDINIQLTSAGADADNFILYYYIAPGPYVQFDTGVSRATLLAGVNYTIPDGSTEVKIVSTGVCTNELILIIVLTTTTSSTSTSTSTSTSSTSTSTSTSSSSTSTSTSTSTSSTSTSTSTSSSSTSTSTTGTTTTLPSYYGIQVRIGNDPASICSSSFVQVAFMNPPTWGPGTIIYNYDEFGQPTTPVVANYVVYGDQCTLGCQVYDLLDGVVGSETLGSLCYIPATPTTSTTSTTEIPTTTSTSTSSTSTSSTSSTSSSTTDTTSTSDTTSSSTTTSSTTSSTSTSTSSTTSTTTTICIRPEGIPDYALYYYDGNQNITIDNVCTTFLLDVGAMATSVSTNAGEGDDVYYNGDPYSCIKMTDGYYILTDNPPVGGGLYRGVHVLDGKLYYVCPDGTTTTSTTTTVP